MADDRVAALELLRKAAGDGDLDFLREGLSMLSQLVMDAEVTTQIGAAHGERAPERRLTQRNGYRERRWDTRVGTIDLQIPKLRDGTYFPSLLEPRRRMQPQRGFSRASRTMSPRTSASIGGPPGRPVLRYVHFLLTSSRCQRSRVAGVTMKATQRSLGIARLAAASNSRSMTRSLGGPVFRWRTRS